MPGGLRHGGEAPRGQPQAEQLPRRKPGAWCGVRHRPRRGRRCCCLVGMGCLSRCGGLRCRGAGLAAAAGPDLAWRDGRAHARACPTLLAPAPALPHRERRQPLHRAVGRDVRRRPRVTVPPAAAARRVAAEGRRPPPAACRGAAQLPAVGQRAVLVAPLPPVSSQRRGRASQLGGRVAARQLAVAAAVRALRPAIALLGAGAGARRGGAPPPRRRSLQPPLPQMRAVLPRQGRAVPLAAAGPVVLRPRPRAARVAVPMVSRLARGRGPVPLPALPPRPPKRATAAAPALFVSAGAWGVSVLGEEACGAGKAGQEV